VRLGEGNSCLLLVGQFGVLDIIAVEPVGNLLEGDGSGPFNNGPRDVVGFVRRLEAKKTKPNPKRDKGIETKT
jgi:hypothetical protein